MSLLGTRNTFGQGLILTAGATWALHFQNERSDAAQMSLNVQVLGFNTLLIQTLKNRTDSTEPEVTGRSYQH